MVRDVREGLNEKQYVAGCISYFESFLELDKNKAFLSGEMKQDIKRYIDVLKKINEGNRDQLDRLIKVAEDEKMKPTNEKN